jgi:hypothetical protein
MGHCHPVEHLQVFLSQVGVCLQDSDIDSTGPSVRHWGPDGSVVDIHTAATTRVGQSAAFTSPSLPFSNPIGQIRPPKASPDLSVCWQNGRTCLVSGAKRGDVRLWELDDAPADNGSGYVRPANKTG